MSLRPQVLSGFRRLLRARRIPFASDPHALSESRKELKTQFMLQKDVTDNGQIIELLKGIDEVEEMLRTSIVQGTVSGEADETRVNVKIREDNKDGKTMCHSSRSDDSEELNASYAVLALRNQS